MAAAPSKKPMTLDEIADGFLELAREEATTGYETGDERHIRDAAEKAWNAANQAVDAAMKRYGEMPAPGPQAHKDRHDFLEVAGHDDLSKDLSHFAVRLHGDCFYAGQCPTKGGMDVRLDEVQQFLRRVREEL